MTKGMKQDDGHCPVCRQESGKFLCSEGYRGQSRDGTHEFWPTDFYYCPQCQIYFSVEQGYYCWAKEENRQEYETVINKKPICFECSNAHYDIQKWVGRLKIEKQWCSSHCYEIAGPSDCKYKFVMSMDRISPVIGRHGVPI